MEKKKKMGEMANRQKQSGGQGQAGEQQATRLTGTETHEPNGETESVRELFGLVLYTFLHV
jgi:hypothetical protein